MAHVCFNILLYSFGDAVTFHNSCIEIDDHKRSSHLTTLPPQGTINRAKKDICNTQDKQS